MDDETPEEKAARRAHWAEVAKLGENPRVIQALIDLARPLAGEREIEFWFEDEEGSLCICIHDIAKDSSDEWFEFEDKKIEDRRITVQIGHGFGRDEDPYDAYLTAYFPDEDEGEDANVDGGFLLIPFNRIRDLPEGKRFPNLIDDLTEAVELLHEIDPGAKVEFFLTDGDDAFENPTVLAKDVLQSDSAGFFELQHAEINGRVALIRFGSLDEGQTWNAWLTLSDMTIQPTNKYLG